LVFSFLGTPSDEAEFSTSLELEDMTLNRPKVVIKTTTPPTARLVGLNVSILGMELI
jgi:hypothetical protein